jgi:hypothetical protein
MIIKIWNFIKQAVTIVHKAIMCVVRLRDLARPSRKRNKPTLGGFLASLLG